MYTISVCIKDMFYVNVHYFSLYQGYVICQCTLFQSVSGICFMSMYTISVCIKDMLYVNVHYFSLYQEYIICQCTLYQSVSVNVLCQCTLFQSVSRIYFISMYTISVCIKDMLYVNVHYFSL